MAKGVTIRHVARRADVSTATVSHVLNNTRYVSDATRERVVEAVRELHYYTSAVARSLVTQETRTVGVIVSDIANSFCTTLFKSIEHELAPLGYDPILENTGANPDNQEHSLELLLSEQVDGIITCAYRPCALHVNGCLVVLFRPNPCCHHTLLSSHKARENL